MTGTLAAVMGDDVTGAAKGLLTSVQVSTKIRSGNSRPTSRDHPLAQPNGTTTRPDLTGHHLGDGADRDWFRDHLEAHTGVE